MLNNRKRLSVPPHVLRSLLIHAPQHHYNRSAFWCVAVLPVNLALKCGAGFLVSAAVARC
jgi:hypothetical protein